MKNSKSEKHTEENSSAQQLKQEDNFLIVGIGASAGGVQALKKFFENVPANSNAAYVVILHLSPDHDSQLAEILQTVAKIPVTQVKEKVHIEPAHVYVVPPNKSLSMRDGHIIVSPIHTVEERRAPVDIFFRTLAESHNGRSVAVILSGTGANGSMGIKRVKEKGGAAFVQNPREAEFGEMPRNSIATELIDDVLNVSEIPAKIIAYQKNLGKITIPVEPESRHEEEQSALREIFTLLKVRTGHDFANYKRPTVLRRIERRINVRELSSLPEYAAYLKKHADETNALLKDLLISVTNFFRDKEAFLYLERDVLPRILTDKTSKDQIRLWVAGCATGEEAYSIAMLLAEKAEHLPDAPVVQIFATDIDENAIAAARNGFYTLNDAADVSPERLNRFFTKQNDGYRIRRELREMILFANHNLLKDPPFSQVDLVTCRNLLIYFNGEAQERVLETFHFALKPSGYLFLGSSESIDGAGDLYSSFNREQRIFQARQTAPRILYPVPDLSPSLRYDQNILPPNTETAKMPTTERISYGELHGRILEQFAPPSIVVNEDYDIVHVSPNAGRFLEIAGGEISRNLFKLIHPELRLPVSTAVYQAVNRETNVSADNLQINLNGKNETVNIGVRPVLQTTDDAARGFILIMFEPAENKTGATVEAVLKSSEPIAEQLEEELLRSQARFYQSIERSEVQAEELKASNEELQAINEELRSATEELETGKEELQSVNEELVTVNQELKIKIEELSQSNNDFQNLINSSHIGTVFLDRNRRVKLFTPAANEIFNFIPADIGRTLSDITHKLKDENLMADVETVLDKLQPIEREVKTENGDIFLMQITPYRTSEDRINGTVVAFVNITQSKRQEIELAELNRRIKQQAEIFDITLSTINDFAYTFDKDGRFIYSNKPLLDLLGITLEEIIGKNFFDLNYPEDLAARLQNQIQQVFDTKEIVKDETPFTSPSGANGFYEYIFNPVFAADGSVKLVAGSTRDISERKRTEANLAFLADFSQVLIPLTSENEIVESFGEKINRLTDASVCAFFEINETKEECVCDYEWRQAGGHSMLGKYDLREFVTAEFQEMMSAGQAFVVRDVAADSRIQDKSNFVALEIGAFLNVPLIRNGEWRFALGVYHEQPYDWREDEIALLTELANRIRSKLERVHAQKKLRESEEWLNLIMKSIKDFAIITTDTSGIINGWNPGAEKAFGYTESEIVGQSADSLFTPEDRKKGVPAKEMQTAVEKGSAEDERWHVRKDGSRFYLSGLMQPIRDGKLDGFVKIARDMTERIKAEQVDRVKKLVSAQEDERRRIARDLHDELGQLLTALRMKLESVGSLREDDKELCAEIAETQIIAKKVDEGIDFLAWELRPAALDDLGLYAALSKYIREWTHYAGVSAELLESGIKKTRFVSEVETNLYRIAQESLNNVYKHAKAKQVVVVLDRRGDLIVLIIEDDGKGFDKKGKLNREKGIGLIGMKERAALIGGTLEIESAPGKGTTIHVRVPFEDGEIG